ncbi:MAG: flagellar biosynthesis protein FliL [Gammaproteobacteria bacterium]|nr:flagellar biosynthesis protein FliL [Gammaproteobacteria bacterium]
MAKKPEDGDLDRGEEKQGSKKKLFIILGLGILLLGGGGGAAWFFLMGDSSSEPSVAAESKEVIQPGAPAIYHSLRPEFIVNLPPGGKFNMLQVGIELMTRSTTLVDFLKHNDPMIRNQVITLFGSQDGNLLRERQGKEALQAAMLELLNEIISSQGGAGEIEDVYFTSFVMQ